MELVSYTFNLNELKAKTRYLYQLVISGRTLDCTLPMSYEPLENRRLTVGFYAILINFQWENRG
jgi:hypothetical protein